MLSAMRIMRQSVELSIAFRTQISERKNARQQEIHSGFDNNFSSKIVTILSEYSQVKRQFKNNCKGFVGELIVSHAIQSLSDEWMMFENALIPTYSQGKLTEVDIIVVGKTGIFLIEVKNWKGSLSAYKDQWKRRQNSNWVSLDSSPTSQSKYHQDMFQRWIVTIVPNLPARFVTAPVIFPLVKWLGVKECSVPVFDNISDLISLITDAPVCLNTEQIFSIAEAIEDYKLDG